MPSTTPYTSRLIVSKLECSLAGREMSIQLEPHSLAARVYGAGITKERYYCNFGVHPDFVESISEAGFRVAGTDTDGECRVMEISQHPFFIGTLYVPQARSRAGEPDPLISTFLVAASRRA